jgi:hypothetical protein
VFRKPSSSRSRVGRSPTIPLEGSISVELAAGAAPARLVATQIRTVRRRQLFQRAHVVADRRGLPHDIDPVAALGEQPLRRPPDLRRVIRRDLVGYRSAKADLPPSCQLVALGSTGTSPSSVPRSSPLMSLP